ncbi:MAG: hypothetical protein ACI81R_001034 [Bradymonadia bacterium]|jgi:hypothetical protein
MRTRTLLTLLCTVAIGCASEAQGDGPARGPDRGEEADAQVGPDAALRDGAGAEDALADVPSVDAVVDTDEEADSEPPLLDGSEVDVQADGVDAADTPVADVTPDTPQDDDCSEITATAEAVVGPVDIIWAIDTSGSMGEEIVLVQEQMNLFTEFMAVSDIDYRVVLIAADPAPCTGEDCLDSLGVCMPEPLSSADVCPDVDSGVYRHVRSTVSSTDAFDQFDRNWGAYSDVLRPDASAQFVVVSDDESGRNKSWFQDRMNPRFPNGFTFHSIVSLIEQEDPDCPPLFPCPSTGCSGPYGDAERRGTQYIVLSRETGGVEASICETDWSAVFERLATGVAAGAALPCVYEIPEIPFSEIVYDRVEVTLTRSEGDVVALERVDSFEQCDGGQQWYYNDNHAPTLVRICPSACGAQAGTLEIGFECVKA